MSASQRNKNAALVATSVIAALAAGAAIVAAAVLHRRKKCKNRPDYDPDFGNDNNGGSMSAMNGVQPTPVAPEIGRIYRIREAVAASDHSPDGSRRCWNFRADPPPTTGSTKLQLYNFDRKSKQQLFFLAPPAPGAPADSFKVVFLGQFDDPLRDPERQPVLWVNKSSGNITLLPLNADSNMAPAQWLALRAPIDDPSGNPIYFIASADAQYSPGGGEQVVTKGGRSGNVFVAPRSTHTWGNDQLWQFLPAVDLA